MSSNFLICNWRRTGGHALAQQDFEVSNETKEKDVGTREFDPPELFEPTKKMPEIKKKKKELFLFLYF